MADSINGSDYGILNWDSPTRVPPNSEPSSPDVSLASASLITSCSWQTLLTLISDHLPILIRLQMKTPSNPGLRRTYANLKKANWDRYRQVVEAPLSNRSLPTDCQRDEIFRTVLLKAASHHIPTRRHRLHEEPVPSEILDVMNRRDDLRQRDSTSPELPRLNKDIQNRICVHKRKNGETVETMVQKTDLTTLWRTIKGIDGRAKRDAGNKAITFNGICCCCLPTPLTLVCGESPIIPLLVYQPAYLSIWPAAPSLQRGLSTNPGMTVSCVCGCS